MIVSTVGGVTPLRGDDESWRTGLGALGSATSALGYLSCRFRVDGSAVARLGGGGDGGWREWRERGDKVDKRDKRGERERLAFGGGEEEPAAVGTERRAAVRRPSSERHGLLVTAATEEPRVTCWIAS